MLRMRDRAHGIHEYDCNRDREKVSHHVYCRAKEGDGLGCVGGGDWKQKRDRKGRYV